MVWILNNFCTGLSAGWINAATALFLQANKAMNVLGIEADSGQGVNTTVHSRVARMKRSGIRGSRFNYGPGFRFASSGLHI